MSARDGEEAEKKYYMVRIWGDNNISVSVLEGMANISVADPLTGQQHNKLQS